MLATSKVWLDRGGSSLNNHFSTIDHQKEEEEKQAKEIAVDFAAGLTRQSTIMNAWNRDYPTGAPRSEGQSAGLETGQSTLLAQQPSPFAVTQSTWSSSPESHTYTALPSINAPIHPGGETPHYGHTTPFQSQDSAFGNSMNYGSGSGSSEYSMLARPHSSGGNQSGGFPMMANRQCLNPPSSTSGHPTTFPPAPGMHSSPNHSIGHAQTFSDPLSGGHYTFGSGGGNTASGLVSTNSNQESSFNHPSIQSGEHERDSYVYSNIHGNLTPLFGGLPGNAPASSSASSHHEFPGFSNHHQSSSSAPSHYHHHQHFGSGGGSTYSMLGGSVPLGHGGHYLGGTGQYEGYPAFYNPFEVKHRRRTTRSQFKVLESTFLETPKPTASTRKVLAEQLDMPLRAIQIWFQNRRAKAKSQSYRSSTSSHSLHGESSSSKSGRYVDSPPLHTSQRTGSGSADVGRPSTSSSSSSYYHGSKSALTAPGSNVDSKPPFSSSSLSSTGSGQTQAGAGFPFEESKRYTYPNTGTAKLIPLSRLDLPPLMSGEPSSGSSSFAPSSNLSYDSFKIPSGKPSQRGSVSSGGGQQQIYPHSTYTPTSAYSGPHSQTLPSNSSGATSSSQSNANDIADEQNTRSHQNSSWR